MFYTRDESKREHDLSAYVEVISQLSAALKPGGTAFITVPFGRRDVRRWVQVFDGSMVDSVIEEFGGQSASVIYFRYTGANGWALSTRAACSNAVYFDYHSEMGWKDCPAAAEAVACLEISK
jgi:hypothetical protein